MRTPPWQKALAVDSVLLTNGKGVQMKLKYVNSVCKYESLKSMGERKKERKKRFGKSTD